MRNAPRSRLARTNLKRRPAPSRSSGRAPGLPRWQTILKNLQHAFPSPWHEAGEDRSFENTFRMAVALLDRMKHPRAFEDQNAWQSYLGDPTLPDYSTCREARLREAPMALPDVIHDLVQFFNGMPNWNHPQTMANVIPPANTAAIIGSTLATVFNPNIVEGEYSWNVAKSEIEAAAIIADLIGWNPETAGGVFTFGGTGCYLYGVKLALTSVLGQNSRQTGVRVDGQVLVSEGAHFAKFNCTDWTGLGMDNVRLVQVDEHNAMSIPHLRQTLNACRRQGKPVVMIVCTMGTTDAFAIDPIAEVRKLVDEFKNVPGYGRPLIYADAVIGWSWLAFHGYDFNANPLEFSPKSLPILKANYRSVATIHHADAIGIDFHKSGWAPYNSSLFMVRDYDRFTSLLGRPCPAYLQDRTPYNPYQFTLEASRSGAYSLAGWATLKLFGKEGFQVMLGRIVEVQVFLRQLLDRDRNLVCVNPDNYGFVTLFRVYPSHLDGNAQYQKELNDPSSAHELRAYNVLQQRVANKLFAMLREPAQRVPGWENPPYTSFTTGFRPTVYARDDTDRRNWVYALKAFPMSPNSNELSMLVLRNYVLKARDLVIAELTDAHNGQKAGLPAQTSEASPASAARTVTWWGQNEEIAIEYLVPGSPVDRPSKARTHIRIRPRKVHPSVASQHATITDLLSRMPVCAHLSKSHLKRLVKSGRLQSTRAGQFLFHEGGQADKVFLLLRGSVQILRSPADGTQRTVATLRRGELFGEMALFERGLRSAAAKTLEPCKYLVFNGPRFLDLVLELIPALKNQAPLIADGLGSDAEPDWLSVSSSGIRG